MTTQHRWVLAAIIGAGLALGGCQEQMNMLKARRAFKEANVAYAAKDYGSAIESYQKVLELDPEGDPRVIIPTKFYMGSSHHLLYRPARYDDPENEAHLEKAIELYTATLEAVDQVTEFKEQLQPYRQYALEQLAAIYRDNLDDFEKAEEYFLALVDIQRDKPEAYYALGDLYERFHDPDSLPLLDKAIEAYEKPVEMSPEDPIPYRQVAALLNKYGRFEDTMAWLGRARDVESDNPEGYYIIATHFWDKVYRDPELTRQQRAEYIQRGLAELDKALELNPEYVDALIYKNLLIREQAKIERNPRRRRELTAEADRYRDLAIELRKKQKEKEEAEKAAEKGQPTS